MRTVHIVQLVIRDSAEDRIRFLFAPITKWPGPGGRIYLSLPTQMTRDEPFAEFIRGQSIEHFVDDVMHGWLKTAPGRYTLEQELPPAACECVSLGREIPTRYEVYPVDVWVHPDEREPLRERSNGKWLAPGEAAEDPEVFVTAKAALQSILERERRLDIRYTLRPAAERGAEAPRRLLNAVPDNPGMDALAKKWLSRNKGGVRILAGSDIQAILDAGNRAFNLRVADPYLRYQMQGVGFTWSFFTHKDGQDIHVHSAPTVEIYGVIDGEMEIWWKPYHDRGTSAWSHQLLGPGDWIEVDALQCHFVHWKTEGRGVVFKAGPGPLIGVGRLGEKGKTACNDCPCMIPDDVKALAAPKSAPVVRFDYESADWRLVCRILDENGRRLSRTRGGTSDTGTSEEKLPLRLAGDALKRRSAENEERVHRFLFDTRNDPPLKDRPRAVKELLFHIADLTNDGLLPEGRFRTWPTGRPPAVDGKAVGRPKLDPDEIPAALDEFCAAVADRWPELDSDAIPLAAMAEWELNGGILHPFYDGCGRISRAFSAALLIRAGCLLPLYEDPQTYFRHGNDSPDAFARHLRERIAACRTWLKESPPAPLS